MRRARTQFLLAALCTAACGTTPEPRSTGQVALQRVLAPAIHRLSESSRRTAPVAEGGRGRIVFVSERSGSKGVYAMRPDGSAIEPLRVSDGDNYLAGLHPKSKQLLVLSSAPESHHENLRLVDGARDRMLGPRTRFLRHPSFFPDGRAVLFEANLSSFRDLYRLDVQSGALERLTREPRGCFEPSVDPSGRTIAFVSSRDGDPEIYRLELNNRQWQRLSWSRGEDSTPRFSPDGRHIAFVSARLGAPRIFVMGADGSKPQALAEHRGGRGVLSDPFFAQSDPRWSPDGTHIAFIEHRQGRANLRLRRFAGAARVPLPAGPWVDQTPAWSPDGQYLLFASSREGNSDLYRMRTDGSDLVRLTRHVAADWLPLWQDP